MKNDVASISIGTIARIEVLEIDGTIHLLNLTVDPDAPYGTLIKLLRKVVKECEGRTVRAVVEFGEGYEKLLKLYVKMGLHPISVTMERQWQE